MVDVAAIEKLVQEVSSQLSISDSMSETHKRMNENTGLSVMVNGTKCAVPIDNSGVKLDIIGTANMSFKLRTSYYQPFKLKEDSAEMTCTLPWSDKFLAYKLEIEMPDGSKINAEVLAAAAADEKYEKAKANGEAAMLADVNAGNVLSYTFFIPNVCGKIEVCIEGVSMTPCVASQTILIPMRPFQPGTFCVSKLTESEEKVVRSKQQLSNSDVPLHIEFYKGPFSPRFIDTADIIATGTNKYVTNANRSTIEIGFDSSNVEEPLFYYSTSKTISIGALFLPVERSKINLKETVPVVICDYSGSMSGENLIMQTTLVTNISTNFEFIRLILFSSTVFYDEKIYSYDVPRILENYSKNLGGTDLNRVFKYIECKEIKEALLITDDQVCGTLQYPTTCKLHCVGIGKHITIENIKAMTEATGGSYTTIKSANTLPECEQFVFSLLGSCYKYPTRLLGQTPHGEVDLQMNFLNQGTPTILCYSNFEITHIKAEYNTDADYDSSWKKIKHIQLDEICAEPLSKASVYAQLNKLSDFVEKTKLAVEHQLLIKDLTKFFANLSHPEPVMDAPDAPNYRSLSAAPPPMMNNDAVYRGCPMEEDEDEDDSMYSHNTNDYDILADFAMNVIQGVTQYSKFDTMLPSHMNKITQKITAAIILRSIKSKITPLLTKRANDVLSEFNKLLTAASIVEQEHANIAVWNQLASMTACC